MFCCLVGVIVLLNATMFAGWPCRTDSSLPVVTQPGNQWNVRLTADGTHGAILVWQDRRNGTMDKLYTQRISSEGGTLWLSGGVALAATAGFQYYPQIAGDDAGNAAVVWQDNRYGLDYDIFIQKVSSEGLPQWTTDGVLVCNASGHQYNPQIVHDSFDDYLVVWQDRRKGDFDIYVQKFNSLGQPLWTANGLVLCSATGDQIDPKIISDGAGGAIIAWTDFRGGSGFSDVYAQRVLAGGVIPWAANGVALSTAANSQSNVQLVSDGANGGIAVWQDRRSGAVDNIYAQRVANNGSMQWVADGLALAPISGVQYYPQAVADGLGGVVAVWQDNRSGSNYDVFAQAVNNAGQVLWSGPGRAICQATGHQYYPQLIRQGGTVVVSWQDKRSGDYDIYGQGLNLNGDLLWSVNGVKIAQSPLDQFLPQMASDGVNGAIVAFPDYQLGTGTTDIFAHRVGANGEPAGGCYRTFVQDSLTQKSVLLRKIARTPKMPTVGNVRDEIFTRGAFSQGLVLGIERTDSAKRYGWIYFTRSYYVRRAFPQNGAARPFDRIFERPFLGRMKNPSPFRYNNAIVGELLALRMNIAASDVGLTASNFGNLIYDDSVHADSPLRGLTLRGIAAKIDTMLTYWTRYRDVDWNDINLSLRRINRSFSGKLDTLSTFPLKITSVKPLFSVPYLVPNPDPPPALPQFIPRAEELDEVPETFTLYQNYPNPFNPTTMIEFELPEAAMVTVRVYNMLGQEVGLLLNENYLEDGYQQVEFDGTNLSSGVYFYHVTATPVSNNTKPLMQVKKMILVK